MMKISNKYLKNGFIIEEITEKSKIEYLKDFVIKETCEYLKIKFRKDFDLNMLGKT